MGAATRKDIVAGERNARRMSVDPWREAHFAPRKYAGTSRGRSNTQTSDKEKEDARQTIGPTLIFLSFRNDNKNNKSTHTSDLLNNPSRQDHQPAVSSAQAKKMDALVAMFSGLWTRLLHMLGLAQKSATIILLGAWRGRRNNG